MSSEIVNGIFGLVGVALGGGIGYASALLANRTFAVSEASNNLRAAFAPQLSTIRFDQSKSAADIQRLLESDIDTITIEMEKFRFFVSPKDLPAYDEACKKYQSVARIREMNYSTLGGKEPFKVFQDKVNGVLRFTKL